MTDIKEKDLNSATTCQYVRALDSNGNSIKIPVADLMRLVPEINLAFSITDLPYSSTNVVGNHDGLPSGYGWYNNCGTGSNDYAPGSSAGIFIRFKANITPITFFMITFGGEKVGELWWRPDEGICSKIK
jgi:hypothetical protein